MDLSDGIGKLHGLLIVCRLRRSRRKACEGKVYVYATDLAEKPVGIGRCTSKGERRGIDSFCTPDRAYREDLLLVAGRELELERGLEACHGRAYGTVHVAVLAHSRHASRGSALADFKVEAGLVVYGDGLVLGAYDDLIIGIAYLIDGMLMRARHGRRDEGKEQGQEQRYLLQLIEVSDDKGKAGFLYPNLLYEAMPRRRCSSIGSSDDPSSVLARTKQEGLAARAA